MKALLSVYDKTAIVEFARALQKANFELVSTGGTYEVLSAAGLVVQRVSDITDFPEILDGRVKTLHPKIHAGILARRDLTSHRTQLAQYGIGTIDLVVVNLYPFLNTIKSPTVTLENAIENIDIGGPTIVRAAGKNFSDVAVVVDPTDYEWIAERIVADEETVTVSTFLTHNERKGLAAKAFQHVALYDTQITRYLSDGGNLSGTEMTLGYIKRHDLRYGENSHQVASVYEDPMSSGGIIGADHLHGTELSFNNVLDADTAWRVVSDFSEPAATVVKHTNPCGLALHPDQPTAYRRALEGDPISAYGGIVGFNRSVAITTVEAMRGLFLEMIVAPSYETEALEALKNRKNLRVLQVRVSDSAPEGQEVRLISGGALVQMNDSIEEDPASWKVVTRRKPTEGEMNDLWFAWKAAKHVKSNAIVLVKDSAMLGMGAGQPNRVTSVHLALRVAGDKTNGSVLASDAFFPFADSIELAAKGGVTAIVQPGGSVRDDEVISAAEKHGLVMLLTGTRHFRH